jgi:hypothetical protein
MIGERRIVYYEDLDLIEIYIKACRLTTDEHSDELRRFAHASDASREVMRVWMRHKINLARSRQ